MYSRVPCRECDHQQVKGLEEGRGFQCQQVKGEQMAAAGDGGRDEWRRRRGSQELITPLSQAAATVFRLLCVRLTSLLQPLDEQLLVLLQHKKLAQDHVRLQGVSERRRGERETVLPCRSLWHRVACPALHRYPPDP